MTSGSHPLPGRVLPVAAWSGSTRPETCSRSVMRRNTVWQTVANINAAWKSTAGVIEIADQTETNIGTDDIAGGNAKEIGR